MRDRRTHNSSTIRRILTSDQNHLHAMSATILGNSNENSSFSAYYDGENDPLYLSAERPDVGTVLVFKQRSVQQGACFLH